MGAQELWSLGRRWYSGVLFHVVPGPLQTVQGTEMWGVILALQARTSVHIGGDNLNVVRRVGKILDGLDEHRPLPLIKDADVFVLV